MVGLLERDIVFLIIQLGILRETFFGDLQKLSNSVTGTVLLFSPVTAQLDVTLHKNHTSPRMTATTGYMHSHGRA